uniref:PD-(D/E)XK nuclease superfamily protein n=1 Tax=Candidatus Kentrum sp. FM TaxID=2126340 RepID=A0A450SQA5_9GAMM|nr:MAG: PD-(D/E)XK nuclease superfamily protein [Candidatus Kentron sp. FM]VFJ56092.1 MAG: PD-(D/E)XK nuclease superfamily protein [Candidatus Kentron sp. FM]VFK06327.1 MAG: PD-(D/E)XK nuclease superfamily protein [Candidatus Kentron sp. FM]
MKFPYGIANFQKIREEGYLYIDRTDRITLMESMGDQLLFLRPRRFGKSLWLSTLENYYDLARTGRFEKIFGGLAIGQDPTPRRNSYYVMVWDFSMVDTQGDTDYIRGALYRHINVCIDDTLARYPEIERFPPIDDAIANFQALVKAIARTDHKLYLFIDEYDNFANEVLVSQLRGIDRYKDLVGGEGVLKSLFKAIKSLTRGQGLDRVFMTGVSPVVMSDISSGYNIIKTISHHPKYNDLCGFTADELRGILDRVAEECGLSPGETDEAMQTMGSFYNGYCFSPRRLSSGGDSLIYNPTLAIYFLEELAEYCEYPERILDTNLAMDRNRIQFVSRLPHGERLVTKALAANETNPDDNIFMEKLADRFGVEDMLHAPKDDTFLASLLYYLGVLTLAGRNELGQLRLTIPNLVVRSLYAERLYDTLVPEYENRQARQEAVDRFYAYADLEPLGDFIEQRFFKVFDNRDLRWSNELTVKTAFLTLLFNDTFYIMDSETAIDRGYADLSLILRPDTRKYKLLDHLLEFKYLPWKGLGIKSEAARAMSREALRELPPVAEQLNVAKAQLARYREILERVYGEKLRLHTHAVVCIGLERLVWE